MKVFTTVSPFDEVMNDIMAEFGYEGFGKFSTVLFCCQEYGYTQLTEEILKNSLKINARGARTLFPKFAQTFTKVMGNFHQTFPKLSPNFDQTEGENPHGSTRAQKVKTSSPSEKKNKLIFIPADFQITESILEWATENSFPADELKRELPQFIDYHTAKGTKYTNWEAAFKTWMRNTRKWDKKPKAEIAVVGSDLWKRNNSF